MTDRPADYEQKVVETRMRLRERFLEKMVATPSVSDARPQGSGPRNRHGMPKLPPGQSVTKKWPVLDLGYKPNIELAKWRLSLTGACEHPVTLTWDELMALPQTDDVSDFHCVTTWSKMDVHWQGVRFADLAALALPSPTATHIMCHGYDGYTTNLALEEALKDDVLLVHTVDSQPLPPEHGGPLRMITPQLYAWKGAKWIKRIEFMEGDSPGYWEARGYSMTALPWREDRYS